MNTQTLKVILHGRLAETEALLESTPHERCPDDFKVLLGRRSMLADLLTMADVLIDQEEKAGFSKAANGDTKIEGRPRDSRWN